MRPRVPGGGDRRARVARARTLLLPHLAQQPPHLHQVPVTRVLVRALSAARRPAAPYSQPRGRVHQTTRRLCLLV